MTDAQLTLLADVFIRWLAWFALLMGSGMLFIWAYTRHRRWLRLLLVALLVTASQLEFA